MTGVVAWQAFCAGGDVRSLYDHRDAAGASPYQRSFFSDEYKLDLDIYNLRVKGTQQVRRVVWHVFCVCGTPLSLAV